MKGIELDLCYKNQNVRGCKALNRGQSLILCTVRNTWERRHATLSVTLGGHVFVLQKHLQLSKILSFCAITVSLMCYVPRLVRANLVGILFTQSSKFFNS